MPSTSNMEVADELLGGMLSVDDAVAFSKLSRAELYVAMAQGELRFFKYGRRRLLARADVVAWLRTKLVPSN